MYADSLKVGAIFKTESDKDLINITVRNTSTTPDINEEN